jgi:hypothetical protein
MKSAREELLSVSLYARENGCYELALSIVMEVAEIDEETGSYEWEDHIWVTEVLDEAEKRALSMLCGKSENKSAQKRKISRFVSELKKKSGRFSGLQQGYGWTID